MAEYTDYQLDLSNIEINNALKLMNSLERQEVEVKINSSKFVHYETVTLQKAHTSEARVFVQIRKPNRSSIQPYQNVIPIVTTINNNTFTVGLISGASTGNNKLQALPPRTCIIDCFIL